MTLPEEVKRLLHQMNRTSIDRCLHPFRFEHPHGLSTTKPGVFLRENIPVRTFTPWEEERPGFEEIDLVAHCGQTTAGQYLNTLKVSDFATGWTECLAILHKSQQLVTEAIQELRLRLPFPLLGIDSDNGSEFINALLQFKLDVLKRLRRYLHKSYVKISTYRICKFYVESSCR